MATFKTSVEGTFTTTDIEHLVSQIQNLPTPHFKGRYPSWEDRARRQFKGSVVITVEELTPLPAPEPDADASQ